MIQRVFDVENEEDIQDLWDILPENVIAIRTENTLVYLIYNDNCCTNIPSKLFKIKWYGKDKITRPIQEATEADIGKLCVFYDNINDGVSYGILEKIRTDRDDFKYLKFNCLYKHCRRLTKQEIEELC